MPQPQPAIPKWGVVMRHEECHCMKDPRFWTSLTTRFWSETTRLHRPRVCSSAPDRSFSIPILSAGKTWRWIFVPLSPSISINAFCKLPDVAKSCLTPWFSFGKSLITIYLPGLCFILLEVRVPAEIELIEMRGAGDFLDGAYRCSSPTMRRTERKITEIWRTPFMFCEFSHADASSLSRQVTSFCSVFSRISPIFSTTGKLWLNIAFDPTWNMA
jgi:hypothetical protein